MYVPIYKASALLNYELMTTHSAATTASISDAAEGRNILNKQAKLTYGTSTRFKKQSLNPLSPYLSNFNQLSK
jgi:hypothetical protein